jgi:hypothetical protein
MFPRAQTACSRTSRTVEESNSIKIGTAPASITTVVWSEVPEAIFVNAHAASNYDGEITDGQTCFVVQQRRAIDGGWMRDVFEY